MKKFKKKLKGPGKDLMPRLMQSGIRSGAAVATAAISTKLMPDPAKGKKNINPNLHGPLFLAVGTIGDVLLQDDNLRAAAQGMAVYGAMRTTAQLSKDKAETNFGVKYFAPSKDLKGMSFNDMMAEQAAQNGLPEDMNDDLDSLDDEDDDL